jgi:hypothetical protein
LIEELIAALVSKSDLFFSSDSVTFKPVKVI